VHKKAQFLAPKLFSFDAAQESHFLALMRSPAVKTKGFLAPKLCHHF
jgi:hypothetical protein